MYELHSDRNGRDGMLYRKMSRLWKNTTGKKEAKTSGSFEKTGRSKAFNEETAKTFTNSSYGDGGRYEDKYDDTEKLTFGRGTTEI